MVPPDFDVKTYILRFIPDAPIGWEYVYLHFPKNVYHVSPKVNNPYIEHLGNEVHHVEMVSVHSWHRKHGVGVNILTWRY